MWSAGRGKGGPNGQFFCLQTGVLGKQRRTVHVCDEDLIDGRRLDAVGEHLSERTICSINHCGPAVLDKS